MKTRWVGVGVALLLGGCSTVEMAQYTVTSFPEVALNKDAKVRIVANGASMEPIAAAVKTEFSKNGGFKVTEEGADYWFIISGLSDYKKSDPVKTKTVVKKEDDAGGQEVLVSETKNLASAAKGVSVAVYNAKSLAPVHYFEIPIYTGDNTKDAVRGKKVYDAAFSKDVVERVKDAFLTQKKDVETPIPLKANGKLRELFAKRDYTGFITAYKNVAKIDLKKFCEDVRTGKYKESDVPEKLGNYYLYLLVKESMTLDPKTLASVKEEQMRILWTSDDAGLAQSVPVALARLEYKLANVGE